MLAKQGQNVHNASALAANAARRGHRSLNDSKQFATWWLAARGKEGAHREGLDLDEIGSIR